MQKLDVDCQRRQIETIKEAVASNFGLTILDLTQGSTARSATLPRQIAIYLVRQLTDASVLEIGRAFERHHTTVVHAIAKMEEERRAGSEVEVMINKLFSVIASKREPPVLRG